MFIISEAAIGGVLQEKVFLEISKNTFSLEYVWATPSFIFIFICIFQNLRQICGQISTRSQQ